jgi:hypothetical protein
MDRRFITLESSAERMNDGPNSDRVAIIGLRQSSFGFHRQIIARRRVPGSGPSDGSAHTP